MRRKIEEKQRLEEEIQNSRAILDQENIDMKTIEEYKVLKDELKKYGLSVENPRRFASVVHTVHRIGNEPRKIITELTHIKSLRQEGRRLKNNCKMWESRAARYKEVLPICEQIISFGIGFPELMALHAAVMKKVDMEKISYGEAAYALMNDIDSPGKKAEMEKQLNDLIMKIQMMNLVWARQNTAANTVMRLLSFGITEEQILNACRVIRTNGHNLNRPESLNSRTYSIF